MANDEHQEQQAPPTAIGSLGRRRWIIAGVVGAAAVLAGGSLLVANMEDGSQPRSPEPGALAERVVVASGVASSRPVGTPSAGTPSAVKAPSPAAGIRTATTPAPSKPASEQKGLTAAQNGVSIKRALTPAPGLPAGPVKMTSRSLDDGGTMRVVTAKHDLSGQRELLWAADEGQRVGNATCTQTLRFSNAVKPKKHPTVLLCWRTSATKSVVTVAVARNGKPKDGESVAEIDRQWSKLG